MWNVFVCFVGLTFFEVFFNIFPPANRLPLTTRSSWQTVDTSSRHGWHKMSNCLIFDQSVAVECYVIQTSADAQEGFMPPMAPPMAPPAGGGSTVNIRIGSGGASAMRVTKCVVSSTHSTTSASSRWKDFVAANWLMHVLS